MAVLADTNILLRFVQPQHPHCAMVERAVGVFRTRNETMNVMAQNLIEFRAVATRPQASENGLGMTIEMVMKELVVLRRLFSLLPEPASVFEEWERLVTTHRVSGRNVHDARLVAAMRLHGIDRILTFNVTDFARCPRIEAIHPQSV
ncbi:MAG: type II toxin-antitoxin system VapC family toxin [Bryobacteraceae bacterium]